MTKVETEASFQKASEDLLRWFHNQSKTKINKKIRIADLRELGQGRGVVAVEDIDEGEELFTIPYDSVLSVENSAFRRNNIQHVQSLESWPALVLTLIYEYGQGNQSRWAPYLNLLPETLDTLMFWSGIELAELQASTVVDKIGKEDADNLFAQRLWPIAEAIPDTFGSYAPRFEGVGGKAEFLTLCHRMASLIFAYGFDLDPDISSEEEREISDDGSHMEEPPKGMVPLADLLNADGDLNNAHLVQDEKTVTMTAIKQIRAGEQIFNDFGELPRSDLLRRYGFVTDRYRKWDVVEIPLTLIIECIDLRLGSHALNGDTEKACLSLADDLGILDDGYDLTRPTTGEAGSVFPSDLILLARALQSNPYDAQKQSVKSSLQADNNDHTQNAYLAWMDILSKRLQQYTTTIAEDNYLLSKSTLTHRDRLAIKVRLGEKEILAEWLHTLATSGHRSLEATDGGAQTQPLKKKKG